MKKQPARAIKKRTKNKKNRVHPGNRTYTVHSIIVDPRPMDKRTNNKTNGKPLVSVIIPVFNGVPYLVDAVESVFRSTYQKFEILLIDDGSTDESLRVCRKLTRRYKRVRFYKFKANRGLARTLNFALKKAKGRYICRLNQDDIMLPHRIASEVTYLERHPNVVAVGSWIRYFENNGKTEIIKFLKDDAHIRKFWYIVSPFSDPTVMYRKDIAIKAGGYVQALWPADDTHLWYRMAQYGKLANIQKPLVNVRWHNQAASVKYFKKLAQSTYAMHLWTDTYLEKAPWYIHIFWFCQYMAGVMFPSGFNWGFYRLLKKGISLLIEVENFLRQAKKKTKNTLHVLSQPKKLIISGVYSK